MAAFSANPEDLASEIGAESLQDLLAAVRNEVLPLGCAGIPSLDSYLVSSENGSPGASLKGGDVLEIQGPPGSGKSQLLYQLLITCLLPRQIDDVIVGGWEKAAVLFDTDNTFDDQQFRDITEQRLNQLLPDRPPLFIKIFVQTASNNLHIFRPGSSLQLAASVLRLRAYQATEIVDKSVGMISIDSLSTFHWDDKVAMELEAKSGNSAATYPLHYVKQALDKVRVSLGSAVVYTNWGLQTSTDPNTGITSPFYRQHLHGFPSLFESSASATFSIPLALCHHITMPLSIYPQLARNASSEDREQWNNARRELIERGELNGIARTPGRETSHPFTVIIGH